MKPNAAATIHAKLENLGRIFRQRMFACPKEQAAAGTEPFAPIEPCYSKQGDGLSMARRGASFCSSFLHRWFNLCDCGAEAMFYLYASPLLQCFAGMNSNHAAAPRWAAGLRFRDLLDRSDGLRPESPLPRPNRRPEFEVSWSTPWLCVLFLLVAILLLY
jgi:hypothetical protein